MYVDLKGPFVVNFIGNPLFFVLACGHVFLPTIKFSGMLIPESYEDFRNGYTMQVPINIPDPRDCRFENYEEQEKVVDSELFKELDQTYSNCFERMSKKERKLDYQKSLKLFLNPQ